MISCLSKEITDTVQGPGMEYRMLGSLVTKLQTNIFRLQVLPEGPYQIYPNISDLSQHPLQNVPSPFSPNIFIC